MWLYKTLVLNTFFLLLAGCGFSPALAPGDPAAGLPGRIEVAAPENRNSFDLVRRLEERLGVGGDTAWILDYTIRTEEEDQGITPDQTITRYHIDGALDFVLTEAATGTVTSSGTVKNFTSYAATGTTVSTLTAQRDAQRRLMVILADQLYARILIAADEITP